MSKRKRRRREERLNNRSSNNLDNKLPFGINPEQLINFLGGNMDFSQIGNMLSSMKNDGVDLNNYSMNNNGYNSNNQMGFDLGPLQGLLNSLGIGGVNFNNNTNQDISENNRIDTVKKVVTESYNNENLYKEDIEIESLQESNIDEGIDEEEILSETCLDEDENIQMLIAIKSIVDPQKVIFIDKVIQAYNKGIFK
ncbi:MAG: hypothetical protein IJO26_04475 [Clostridium sp.]|nr:hypothetical protein [Clostridium sp.]